MKSIVQALLSAVLAIAAAHAQEVIPLPFNPQQRPSATAYHEKQYFSKPWNTEVVTNVSKPTLTVYRPLSWTANGAAIVICPGGAFMALSITSEGSDVAKWLVERGFTAFVLKYRLAHTEDDATEEFGELWKDQPRFMHTIEGVVPLSIADGMTAVGYVRKHASEWNVSPEKVGIIGFSAGGTVTAAVALQYPPAARPAFAAPIYAAASVFKNTPVPNDAPPLFLAAASDDSLNLAGDSITLYEKWVAAHKSAELHMFARGGHGFGMRKQGLPSDEWIDRFWDWLKEQGILAK